MTIKFSNAVGGRKKPLNLSSLFLFHPDCILKLSGLSTSGMMKEAGYESFYKRMQKQVDDAAALRLAHEMSQKIQNFPQDLIAAINGDVDAQASYEKIGVWEVFGKGINSSLDEDKWPQQLKFHIGIERETYQPWILFHQQQYDEAVVLLLKSPLVQLLLWPEAIDILNRKSSLDDLLPLRALVALEMVLSLLAGMDAEVCHLLSKPNSLVLDVLPTTLTGDKNPTSLFFGWIKKQIGLTSISAILNAHAEQSSEFALDESLLKRWSNGSHMPSEKVLRGFLDPFFDDPEAKDIWMRHYGTKCLTFIGYQAQQIQQITYSAAKTDILKDALRPWPDMPFGFKSIEAWFENRYPYWFDYHREQIQGEGNIPSPKT